MITIRQARSISGQLIDEQLPAITDREISAEGMLLLPGLIDPHVHFRIPGEGYKEDWQHAGQAALRGGFTTVLDMPNNIPACVSKHRLIEKKHLINEQLADVQVPLRYGLYLGADKNHFDQIEQVKQDVVGIKVFMGSSTGDLMMDDDSSLHAIFALAAAHDLLVAVHAENECMIATRQQQFAGSTDYATHSQIRTPEVALAAVKQAIALSACYGTRLYILHVSTQLEIEAIAEAKAAGLPVFAETTPHHLFLNTDAYQKLKGRAQVNPPLRDPDQQSFLFQAIRDGIIDTIGSDHAPHTMAEKDKAYGQAPSGMPGIETNLPLLLTAYHRGDLTLAQILKLTYTNPKTIFGLTAQENDRILVDLDETRTVQSAQLKTKCAWSPFEGQALTGWPVMAIVHDQVFDFRIEDECDIL